MHLRRPAALIGLLIAGHAVAATLPARKTGLWQTTMTITGMVVNGKTVKPAARPFITVTCDPGAALNLPVAPAAEAHCPAATMTPDATGKKIAIAETCKHPDGATTSTTGTLVYDSDTATHLDLTMTSPNLVNTMHLTSKYLGACPTGMSPGDFGQMINGKFQKLPAA